MTDRVLQQSDRLAETTGALLAVRGHDVIDSGRDA